MTYTHPKTPIGKKLKDAHTQLTVAALYIRKWVANVFTSLLVFWWIQSGQVIETAKTAHVIVCNTAYVTTHIGGYLPWKHRSD